MPALDVSFSDAVHFGSSLEKRSCLVDIALQ